MSLESFLRRCIYPVKGHPKYPTWEAWTIDYELINKLVLKALFEEVPDFLSPLVPSWTEPRTRPCMVEPEGMLYDLVINPGPTGTFIEIKTWSRLNEEQIGRQLDRLKDEETLHYLLLAKAATEWSREKIQERTKGRSTKIGYKEILDACARVSGSAQELAKAYALALKEQRERLPTEWADPDL